MGVVFIPFLGHGANGARRWISLPLGLTLQPSEFAKLAAMLWAAYRIDIQVKQRGIMYLFEPHKWGQYKRLHWLWKAWAFVISKINRLWKGLRGIPGKLHPDLLLPSTFAVPILYAVITMFQPDMGTAILNI